MAKKQQETTISFASRRRFGIELEVNAFDGKSRPDDGNPPKGIKEVCDLVNGASQHGAVRKGWENTENNASWVVKPDSSCGMEVVSPALCGWDGLKDVLCVVNALSKDERVQADDRCSVHVHCEVADLSEAQLANVISWWVKSELVIMDAMPLRRKRNRYCQLIGMNDVFDHDGNYNSNQIISKVGDVKYYSMNTYHRCRQGRPTIEFRVTEGTGGKDAYLIKQWVRFLIHFVDVASKLPAPKPYLIPEGDNKHLTPWTGFAWLEPAQVLKMLYFDLNDSELPGLRSHKPFKLSNGLMQTRDWFLGRLYKFMSRHPQGGLRHNAYKDLMEIVSKNERDLIGVESGEFLSPTERDDSLFNDNFVY